MILAIDYVGSAIVGLICRISKAIQNREVLGGSFRPIELKMTIVSAFRARRVANKGTLGHVSRVCLANIGANSICF